MSDAKDIIDSLRTIISRHVDVPYCSGTVLLDGDSSILFYKSDSTSASFVDFWETTKLDLELERLSAACQPATFGLDKVDVLDESYRKAGTMDAADISVQFSPADLGIIKIIGDRLLPNREEGTFFDAELYKLNVYGPGSFFKSHVDTPRSDAMFGSLVIVLPTPHEGGSLVIRHGGEEWSFDTAKSVMTGSHPQASFISFFSDVEHEVMTVTSGYRVTLTYNLSFKTKAHNECGPAVLANTESQDIELGIKHELAKLIEDRRFLSQGGYIGFGLSYKYPFNQKTTKLSEISARLKGIDSAIKRACSSLSINVQLKTYYTERGNEDTGEGVLMNEFTPVEDYGEIEDAVAYHLKEHGGGKVVWSYDTSSYGHVRNGNFEDGDVPIVWARPLAKINNYNTPYIAHGNQAILEYAYCELCLIATIPSINSGARR